MVTALCILLALLVIAAIVFMANRTASGDLLAWIVLDRLVELLVILIEAIIKGVTKSE